MPKRRISRCHQILIDVITVIAFKMNITDYEYNIMYGSKNINCFGDGLFQVKIKGFKYGQKIKTSFIIKLYLDKSSCIRDAYRREYIYYESIAPQILDVQRNFNVIEGLKLKIPNCVFASVDYGKESIAICDLLADGFRIPDRFHATDMEHASLVIKNLAKMHALSFALEYTNSKDNKHIKELYNKDIQYSEYKSIPKYLKYYYNSSVNVIADPLIKQKLLQLAPDILRILNKCTLSAPYSAICHGDCWKNNVLFKYKGKKPVDVIFVDYQLSRYASPVTDISYYFYMSTERHFLEKHYDYLIDVYYGTLAAVLRQCYLDVEDVYPKHIFQKHLQEYSVYGMIEALVSMKIITADSEEAFKMTQMKYQSSGDGLYEHESQNQSLYVERVNGVVNDFFNRNYSLDAILNNNN